MVLKRESDKPQVRNRLYYFCFSCFRSNLTHERLFSMLRARTKKNPTDYPTGFESMTPGYRTGALTVRKIIYKFKYGMV